MLGKKEGELLDSKEKYETGVIKLTETGEVVSKLEEELKVFAVEVEAAKKAADEQRKNKSRSSKCCSRKRSSYLLRNSNNS